MTEIHDTIKMTAGVEIKKRNAQGRGMRKMSEISEQKLTGFSVHLECEYHTEDTVMTFIGHPTLHFIQIFMVISIQGSTQWLELTSNTCHYVLLQLKGRQLCGC